MLPVSWVKFQSYWRTHYPQIELLKKKTGFCEICCREQEKLNDKHLQPDEKEIIKKSLEDLLKEAKDARDTYTDHRRLTALEDGEFVIFMDHAE